MNKDWCNKRGNILERPYCKCINSSDPNGRDEKGKPNCKGPFLGITRKFTPHKKIVEYHKNSILIIYSLLFLLFLLFLLLFIFLLFALLLFDLLFKFKLKLFFFAT